MEKIYGMHRLVGLQLFLSGTPTFSSGTPTFCQMGVLNSCFQNPSESSDHFLHLWYVLIYEQNKYFHHLRGGTHSAQWLSGRVLDMRPRAI